MGIIELFETGFFEAFWNWSNPLFTILVYACVAMGAVIQLFLQRNWNKSKKRWLLIVLCVIGIIICEFFWHNLIGWDRLTVDFFYAWIVYILLGATIAIAITSVINKCISADNKSNA